MHTVQIYRDNLPLFGVKPESDSTQIKRVMGENDLRISFKENQYINFRIRDKAFVFGEWYYMNQLPQVTKLSSVEYEYSATMQSTYSILAKTQYLFLGNDNSLKQGDFSLTGKAIDFLNLIIQNAKRQLPYFDFRIGECINTDFKTLTFSTEDCLSALAKVAETFDTEYWVEGEAVSLAKVGRDTGYTFRHGRRKGLYEIVRQTVNNQNVITRLYAFGSDKNLPENYRSFSKRLKLPSQGRKTITNLQWNVVDNGDGSETYTLTWDTPEVVDITGVSIYYRPVGSTAGFTLYGTGSFTSPRTVTLSVGQYEFLFRTETPSGPSPVYDTVPIAITLDTIQPAIRFSGEVIYLEKNVDKYGLSEATINFDDIYPHRIGTVTSVNAGNVFEFTDSAIDFNVNSFLLPGMTAKVTFNTGQLSGYTFEISSFDNSLKKFTILKNKNERVLDIPSTDFKPVIGDKYVLIDVKMPQTYIDAAEQQLKDAAQAELDVLAEPQLAYQLIFDPVYLQKKGFNIKIGDLIWIIDTALEVQRKLRVTAAQRNIINEYEYQLEVADALSTSKIQALTSGQGALNDSVSNINSNLQNNSILNNRVIGDLIITGEASLIFEDLQPGTGLTPVGVDSNGKLWKI